MSEEFKSEISSENFKTGATTQLKRPWVTIIGAGIAGLSAGYYLKNRSIQFTIYEAQPFVGGNCRTIEFANHRFDTGPHRLHLSDPQVAYLFRSLLGDALREVVLPNRVYLKGKLLDFPLRFTNLVRTLGVYNSFLLCYDCAAAALSNRSPSNLRDLAYRSYGRLVSDMFLLNYSEKLWGAPPESLSPVLLSKRLKGLSFKSLLIDLARVGTGSSKNPEGRFYYPVGGIGVLAERLVDQCGEENIKRKSPVEKIHHSDSRIVSIAVGGHEIPVNTLISTIPLPDLLRKLEPAPPHQILELASQLTFRDINLIGLLIKANCVSSNSTIYFPSKEFVFTRVYEPRNRCPTMAPEGKTCLMVEIPCSSESNQNQIENFPPGVAIDYNELPTATRKLIDQVISELEQSQLIRCNRIAGAFALRMEKAYPVLLKDSPQKVEVITKYLRRFSNLKLAGRVGTFRYLSTHEIMLETNEIVDKICAGF